MNITLEEALKSIYFWSIGLTIRQLRREVPISKECACDLYRFLREVNGCVVIKHGTPVGGLDANGNPIIVEIDESKFGKIKYNRVSKI